MRENYMAKKGQRRLLETHLGARYVWRAGKDVPECARKERVAASSQ